jgi:hypothetical protein
MTADIGRFPLVEPVLRGTTDEDDCSREFSDCAPMGVP